MRRTLAPFADSVADTWMGRRSRAVLLGSGFVDVTVELRACYGHQLYRSWWRRREADTVSFHVRYRLRLAEGGTPRVIVSAAASSRYVRASAQKRRSVSYGASTERHDVSSSIDNSAPSVTSSGGMSPRGGLHARSPLSDNRSPPRTSRPPPPNLTTPYEVLAQHCSARSGTGHHQRESREMGREHLDGALQNATSRNWLNSRSVKRMLELEGGSGDVWRSKNHDARCCAVAWR
jgi:hypothetical protein